MSELPVLLPGSVVGVIGGGQLGRYFVLEARRMGYVTWVLDPDPSAPAMQLAEHALVGAYDDDNALQTLSAACDAVTIEFENVPAESLELVAQHTHVSPPIEVVRVAQDRVAEKQAATRLGLTTVPYGVISNQEDIPAAVASITLPAILKTARMGYDGKGQVVCHSESDVVDAFETMGGVVCVLEQRIALQCELSVVLARSADGQVACFPVAQNIHTDGILDTSTVPAHVPEALQNKAQQLAVKFAQGLDYHGVLAIEFFVSDEQELLFNEMAPRPHNSGHYTLDATACSQFDQQLRALCGLPLGSTALLSPVVMLNILGDSWPDQAQPQWLRVLAEEGVQLHLYGKQQARKGRKMGHINCLGSTSSSASLRAQTLRSVLTLD